MYKKLKRGARKAVVVAVCCFLLATKGADGIAATEGRGGDGGVHAGGDGTAAREDGGGAKVQPHIVLIVADDLGWNDVPWNNKKVQAPQLEALAREGVILNQSYVQPVCTPSRSALLGGRYPFTVGRQHGVISPPEPTGLDLGLELLPETLREVGYSTHAVGKWHLGFCSWPYTPTERGFDTFYGYYTGAEDYYTHERDWTLRGDEKGAENDPKTTPEPCNDLNCDHPFAQQSSDAETVRKPYLDLRNNTTPDRSKHGVYSAHLFASQVENLLVSRKPQVPMFLYLAFQSVHSPLQVPERYITPYAYIKDHKRRTYLGMVSAMDEAIGRVVTALKNTGHYQDTIIIFTTDNGGPTVSGGNNWPLRGNKTTLWEGGTRGAAFVHAPFLPNPGTTNPTLIHITDWFPTLMGEAGGVAPEGVDGVDQWAAIVGAAPSTRYQLVYNIDNTTEFNAGIRMGKYKLLVGDPGPGEWTPPPENIPTTLQETPPLHDPSPSPSTTPSDGDDVREKMENDNDTTTTTTTTIPTTTTTTTTTIPTTTTTTTKDKDKEDELEEVLMIDKEEEKEKEEEEKKKWRVAAPEEGDGVEAYYFGGEVSRILQDMSGRNDTKVRLYDLDSDPLEQHNLADTHTQVVSVMAHLLKQHLDRYTPADVPGEVPAADPSNWDQVWSPGWC